MNNITNSLSYQLYNLSINIFIIERLTEELKERYKSIRYKNKVSCFERMIIAIVDKYEFMLLENQHYDYFEDFKNHHSVLQMLSLYYDLSHDNEILQDLIKEIGIKQTIDNLINELEVYNNKICYMYIDDDLRNNEA